MFELEALTFSKVAVSDLTDLAGLTGLPALPVGYTQVEDLSPLAGLSELKWLNLNGTRVTDLSPRRSTSATLLVSVLRWFVLAIASVPLIGVSWRSLREPRSHGFARFFAWEAILGLLCLNGDAWFRHPFAWHQLVSWVLLSGSCFPLYFGVRALVKQGKPTESRPGEASLIAFEKTSELVTSGVYGYLRHPLYASLLYLAWGVFFKLPGWLGLGLAGLSSVALYATARADEAECVRFFGPQYQAYMARTKRFVPFVF